MKRLTRSATAKRILEEVDELARMPIGRACHEVLRSPHDRVGPARCGAAADRTDVRTLAVVGHLVSMTMIDRRPAIVADRVEMGHWDGD